MKGKIVVINGTGGCGKDTFIEYVAKYTSIVNFSSIDIVKDVAKVIGWTGQKTEKDRKFLSDLKKLTTEYNDMAFHSIEKAVEEFHDSNATIMFIHIREPEEILRVVDKFGALTLLIKRVDLEKILSNYSDASVENYNYDFTIINDTLEQLEKDAKQFVEKLAETK